MYQPTIDSATKIDAPKGIAITELFRNNQEIQDAYAKIRPKLSLDDIVDRPIRIVGWELVHDKDMKGNMAEFIRFRYYLDGDDENEKYTSTQAMRIKERLMAIPNELIEENGGLLAMIQARGLPNGGKAYSFAGL